MTIDQGRFRQALSHFASGVTVVTTCDGAEPVGMTVSAFASLSLDPPLVLICVKDHGRTHDAIARTRTFAVNILTDEQEHIARRFAARDGDRFLPGSNYMSENGLPLLEDGLATIECRLVNTLPGGDHSIYVGEVFAAAVGSGQPLLHYRSQFEQLAPAAQINAIT